MRDFAEGYVAMRERMGLPAVDIEQVGYARAAEIVTARVRRVDLLTSRDVAAAVRTARAHIRQEERRRQYSHLVAALVSHVARHTNRLSEEAGFENRARRQRGRPAASLESMVVQLATQEVRETVATDRLTVEDARRAGRIARSSTETLDNRHLSTPRQRGLCTPTREVPRSYSDRPGRVRASRSRRQQGRDNSGERCCDASRSASAFYGRGPSSSVERRSRYCSGVISPRASRSSKIRRAGSRSATLVSSGRLDDPVERTASTIRTTIPATMRSVSSRPGIHIHHMPYPLSHTMSSTSDRSRYGQ